MRTGTEVAGAETPGGRGIGTESLHFTHKGFCLPILHPEVVIPTLLYKTALLTFLESAI